jgi:hypothetical protein
MRILGNGQCYGIYELEDPLAAVNPSDTQDQHLMLRDTPRPPYLLPDVRYWQERWHWYPAWQHEMSLSRQRALVHSQEANRLAEEVPTLIKNDVEIV